MEEYILRKDLERKTKEELINLIIIFQDKESLRLEGEKWGF